VETASLADMLKKLAPQASNQNVATTLSSQSPVSSNAPATDLAPVNKTLPPPQLDFDKAELARLSAEAEAAFSALTSASSVPVLDDPLAAKKLERLIKQPQGERTPFSS